MKLLPLLSSFSVLFASALLAQETPRGQSVSFENEADLKSWKVQGNVTIETGDAFHGGKSLRIERAADAAHIPVSAVGPEFPVAPGIWEIRVAGKADIYSPDNSYNGRVSLECLDASGKMLERFSIGDFDRQKNWTVLERKVEVPEKTVSARFQIEMNKTHGVFKVDSVTATFRSAGRSATDTVDRILFQSAQVGNLLYPTEPRTFRVSVETFKPLAEDGRQLTYEVRDYWGAEQSKTASITLTEASKNQYEGTIDLTSVPLEVGRYYEIHASVPQINAAPATNYTSFAILPEAITKKYPPMEIPFTSRNWDNRIEEFYPLTDRIGVRICGIWGRWSPTPPYEAQAQRIDLVEKYGMGALTTTQIHAIEHQSPGWEKYDEPALRGGVRTLIEKIGNVRPLVINLGNEPPANDLKVIKRDVEAYKIVYKEIKKIDPGIFVLGSSAGPVEEFFKEGFGEWCDAYDFHTYDDSKYIRGSIHKYRELFAKYGHAKPIWATEVGLNSQGLERRVVSVDMIKKFTSFFAAGGANVSWFGLIYPDPELKLHGGSEDAHNVFDCRYKRYAPKLDAVTYYHSVNAIANKKFVEEKTYPNGIYAALFRNAEGETLQVLWREEGIADVSIPLPSATGVKLIRIDGRTLEMDASAGSIGLSVGPDPLLLLYKSATAKLAPELPALKGWDSRNQAFVAGTSSHLDFANAPADSELLAPPLWQVQRAGTGVSFDVTASEASDIREADLLLVSRNERGGISQVLSRRMPVTGKLALRVLPEPADANGSCGARLMITNNGKTPEKVAWEANLTQELVLDKGKFGDGQPATAQLKGETSGSVAVEPGQTNSFVIPMENVDPNKLYRIIAKATDSTGMVSKVDRLLGGFVGVPNAGATITLDGKLNEPVWSQAVAQVIDAGNHFFPTRKTADAWTDAADLSAKVRFAWDEKYLYVAAEVTDNIAGGLRKDSAIWSQDGLQFLIDPARESPLKPGKYDYAVAISEKGPQSWCYLTADSALAPPNEVKEIQIATERAEDGTGSITYELAIPWQRIAPFQPRAGANLGLTLILNEDDGKGRDSFMAWFGNAHTKQVDTAGDLVLLPK